MIESKCFQESWIREQAEALEARDLRTLEKNILALELVSRLRQGGLDFIFKGGTSLALFFDPVRRLSIDVDILSLEPIERLKEVLASATDDKPPFLGFEHQTRRDRESPPTKHFKIPFTSAFGTNPANFIILDLMIGESPYAATESKVVRSSFFEITEEVSVMVPSASSLLADKVACFAPTTIGYPYVPFSTRPGRVPLPEPMKVVKHLFDVGELATLATNIPEATATYAKVHAEQLRYDRPPCTIDDALDDTQDAAFWVCRRELRPNETHERIEFFKTGIKTLDSHLFRQPFQTAESRLAAARAALAAELIRQNTADFDLPAFLAAETDNARIGQAKLVDRWANLNRLLQTNPKAFECWEMAQSLAGRK